MNDILLYFTLKYKGDWESIYQAISEKESVDYQLFKKVIKKNKFNYISIISKDYPNHLKKIYKPPFSIFYYGKENLFRSNLISLFGDKNIDNLIQELKNKKNYFSFLVNYQDDLIIEKLLKEKFNLVVLSDTGLDKINNENKFKEIIRNNNLIFTEFPYNNVNKFFSQYSLRIFAGLSSKVLLMEKFKKNRHTILKEICDNENIPIYSYLINQNNMIKKINSVNEIKENFN